MLLERQRTIGRLDVIFGELGKSTMMKELPRRAGLCIRHTADAKPHFFDVM